MAIVVYKNKDERVEVLDGENLKKIIRDNSWAIPFGCEDGICGTCLVRVVEGFENLSELSEKEKMTLPAMGLDDGIHRLACQCSVLQGEIVIENS
jgi:ferredoxin